jgi:hypothetical protein
MGLFLSRNADQTGCRVVTRQKSHHPHLATGDGSRQPGRFGDVGRRCAGGLPAGCQEQAEKDAGRGEPFLRRLPYSSESERIHNPLSPAATYRLYHTWDLPSRQYIKPIRTSSSSRPAPHSLMKFNPGNASPCKTPDQKRLRIIAMNRLTSPASPKTSINRSKLSSRRPVEANHPVFAIRGQVIATTIP